MKVRDILQALINRVSYPYLVNEEKDSVNEQILTLSNTAEHGGDGWVQLSPFGDFDNSGGMQRVNREAAAEIVQNFKSLANTAGRVMGLPWYIGHPDHPSGQGKYNDTRAYGRVKDLEVRDDGLYGKVKWTTAGKDLINEEAFHGHSTNWKVRRVGNTWTPFLLKSVGFTNEPNIPVKPILVANEKTNENPMLKKLVEMLKLKPEATETEIESAVQGLVNEKRIEVPNWLCKLMGKPAATVTEAETFVNEAMAAKDPLETCNSELADWKKKHGVANEQLTTVRGELTTAQGTITTLTNERDSLKTKATTAETNFVNERKRSVKLLLDGAITAGRITQADRQGWETDLANEATFEAKVEALGKLTSKLNTQSMVNVAERNSAVISRGVTVHDLVNEEMKANGQNYDAAWEKIKKTKPQLFEQMQQPEHARAKAQK